MSLGFPAPPRLSDSSTLVYYSESDRKVQDLKWINKINKLLKKSSSRKFTKTKNKIKEKKHGLFSYCSHGYLSPHWLACLDGMDTAGRVFCNFYGVDNFCSFLFVLRPCWFILTEHKKRFLVTIRRTFEMCCSVDIICHLSQLEMPFPRTNISFPKIHKSFP